ncbi:MAG: hypothetical protein ACRBBU_10835 [Pseudooceanicola sp.]
MSSRSRIISCVGLTLFGTAAVFWADYYTYMKPARNAGEPFGLVQYADSVKARMSGQPDAATLRRDRRLAQEKAERQSIVAVQADKLNRRSVSDRPSFAKIKSPDDADDSKRGFLDGGTKKGASGAMGPGSGIRFIGSSKGTGCTFSGSIKRCRVGG